MIVKLAIHPDQIRYHAQSAINSFQTLSTEDAIANAIAEMEEILKYLDRTDNAVTVLGVRPVEARIGGELPAGNAKGVNLTDLEIVRP